MEYLEEARPVKVHARTVIVVIVGDKLTRFL
jgi:hypothetical protein